MLMSVSMAPRLTGSREESDTSASSDVPVLASDASAHAELQPAGAARWKALSRLRQRWLQFQQRQVSRCHVFVVPCVAMRGAGCGGEAVFVLARPAFDLRWLRPLQRLADAHPRLYIGFGFFSLTVPGIVFSIVFTGENSGISILGLNIFMCIIMFGFLSSKRNGLDRVAVKHVALSFRFAIIVTLLATNTALNIRRVYKNDQHPAEFVAAALRSLVFCLSILLDCSPHLPPSVQIFISVNAHNVAYREFVCLSPLQGGWWVIFGYLTFLEFQRVSSGLHTDLDCFIDLGAYKVCNVTQRLSLDTSILLLMTQAFLSRILLPGISNFVNASVRRSHPRACCGTTMVL
jgi:hypothetical protein